MGNGNYSHAAHEALLQGRTNIPAQQVFQQKNCHPLMNPKGVRLRESRDGADHPQSLGIVFALDVTGSMGEIPRIMATQQLPIFMKTLMDCNIPDPQLLFMAVGDAVSDRAPLQVGQYESTAELMDQWLTWSWLEGGGGGSGQESYELGLYFLATHTEMDCMTKRNKRGYLFMTGDEIPYPTLSKHVVETVIGDRLDEDLTCEEIVAEAQKTFTPFFIIPDLARAKKCERRWRDLLGDHVLCLESPVDVCYVTAGAILISEGRVSNVKELANLLSKAGMPSSRQGAVIRSLTPFADVVLGTKPQSGWLSRLFG
ncbi:MAG: VWA domain-containing protein [Chloroflexi bacterium]|nr:VWA domain-containing protein [Chloroflexota bacterium]